MNNILSDFTLKYREPEKADCRAPINSEQSMKQNQYSAYLSNGGTMSLEEWEKDGRFDKSLIE